MSRFGSAFGLAVLLTVLALSSGVSGLARLGCGIGGGTVGGGGTTIDPAVKRDTFFIPVTSTVETDPASSVTTLESMTNSYAFTACPLSSFDGLTAANDVMQIVGPTQVNSNFTMTNASMVVQANLLIVGDADMADSGLMLMNITSVTGVLGVNNNSMAWVRAIVELQNLNLDSSSYLDLSGTFLEKQNSSYASLIITRCPTLNGSVSVTLSDEQLERILSGAENLTLPIMNTPCNTTDSIGRLVTRHTNGTQITSATLSSQVSSQQSGGRFTMTGLFSLSSSSSQSGGDEDAPASSLTSGPSSPDSNRKRNAIIIGCTVGGVVLLAAAIGLIMLRVPAVRKAVFPYRRPLQ